MPSERETPVPRAAETAAPHVFGLSELLRSKNELPKDNLFVGYKHNEKQLIELSARFSVEVRESQLPLEKGQTRGCYATRDIKKGDAVCYVLGRFGYDAEYARKAKSVKLWKLQDAEDPQTGETKKVYINGSPYCPATYVNDGKHEAAKGMGLEGEQRII